MVIKRIDCGLARRAAAEIACSDNDFGIAPRRLVKWEIGLLFAFGLEAKIVEQHFADAHGARPFQKARRQNLVCIKIAQIDFFCRDASCTEIDTLSLLAALPI